MVLEFDLIGYLIFIYWFESPTFQLCVNKDHMHIEEGVKLDIQLFIFTKILQTYESMRVWSFNNYLYNIDWTVWDLHKRLAKIFFLLSREWNNGCNEGGSFLGVKACCWCWERLRDQGFFFNANWTHHSSEFSLELYNFSPFLKVNKMDPHTIRKKGRWKTTTPTF